MAAPEVELALDDIRSAFGAFAKSIKAGRRPRVQPGIEARNGAVGTPVPVAILCVIGVR